MPRLSPLCSLLFLVISLAAGLIASKDQAAKFNPATPTSAKQLHVFKQRLFATADLNITTNELQDFSNSKENSNHNKAEGDKQNPFHGTKRRRQAYRNRKNSPNTDPDSKLDADLDADLSVNQEANVTLGLGGNANNNSTNTTLGLQTETLLGMHEGIDSNKDPRQQRVIRGMHQRALLNNSRLHWKAIFHGRLEGPMDQDGLSIAEDEDEAQPDNGDLALLTARNTKDLGYALGSFERSFRGQTYPESCVRTSQQSSWVNFTLPAGVECSSQIMCSFQQRRLDLLSVMYRYAKKADDDQKLMLPDEPKNPAKIRKAKCEQVGVASCAVPSRRDYSGSSMVTWNVRIQAGEHMDSRWINYLGASPERPFQILSLFHSRRHPGFYVVIGYFFPRSHSETQCNTLYCIYQTEGGLLHEYPAQAGDMGFVYCPIPSKKLLASGASLTLHLTYDHKAFSLPFPLKIDVPRIDLPSAFMSICAIVKREGQNLHPWIEYHRLMGYDRFVLYDNNPTPDPEMERIVESHPDYVVRVPWPHRHAQTEALTDCIYRFGPITKWMTFIDVDEYMAPSKQYSSVKEILLRKFSSTPYIFSSWLVFGPCDKPKSGTRDLIMEICDNVLPTLRWVPKPTFQAMKVAGIQGYSAHHVRLESDVGVRETESQVSTHPLIYVYHYRYKTWSEFIKKRLGDTAGRVLSRSERDVKAMWNAAKRRNRLLVPSSNRILRFLPRLKQRLNESDP